MKRKKFVLTDLNHLGATYFSALRDPYFGNRWFRGPTDTKCTPLHEH